MLKLAVLVSFKLMNKYNCSIYINTFSNLPSNYLFTLIHILIICLQSHI